MSEPLPENIRRAGYDALEELSSRMFRGGRSLLRHAVRLQQDEPKSHREAVAQLRRYQGFKMPCSEEVAVIEGALTGLTEPESRALSERRRVERNRQERAARKVRDEHLEKQLQQGGWLRRETVRNATSRAALLSQAASHVEKNAGSVDLAKTLVRCLDVEMAGGDPFCVLASQLRQIDGHREELASAGDNVISGPWDTAG